MKLDDAVRSGETLTFGSYLVDIGDLHGERKPIPNMVLQREKTMAGWNGTPKSKAYVHAITMYLRSFPSYRQHFLT